MSQFLAVPRVFDLLAQSPSPAQDRSGRSPSPSNEAYGEVPSPTPTPKRHSSSSSGDEYLAVPICAIVFFFLYKIIKTVMAPFSNRNRNAPSMPTGGGGLTQEEVAVLHKLQRTLTQMESRVEALETILIEQARTEKNYGSKL